MKRPARPREPGTRILRKVEDQVAAIDATRYGTVAADARRRLRGAGQVELVVETYTKPLTRRQAAGPLRRCPRCGKRRRLQPRSRGGRKWVKVGDMMICWLCAEGT